MSLIYLNPTHLGFECPTFKIPFSVLITERGGASEVAPGVFTESLFVPTGKPSDLVSHSPDRHGGRREIMFTSCPQNYTCMHVVAPSAPCCKRMNKRMN